MNVLLVNPPIGVAENRPPNNIPTGLAILTAMLRDCGHHVAVLDLNATRPDAATTEALIQDDPHEYDLIGLSGLITTLAWQERPARSLRARHPKALLVSGGGLATDIGPDLLSWMRPGPHHTSQQHSIRRTQCHRIRLRPRHHPSLLCRTWSAKRPADDGSDRGG